MKKIPAILMTLLVVCIFATTAFAAELYDALELTNAAYTGEAVGFTWTESEGSEVYDTLTILEEGLDISSSDDALVLPAGSTIVLEGDLNIVSDGYGISYAGDLTIEGTGTLKTSTYYTGVRAEGSGNITIQGSVTVETKSANAYGDMSIQDTATLTATEDIYCDAITVADGATVNGMVNCPINDQSGSSYKHVFYGSVTISETTGTLNGTMDFKEGSSLTILEGVIADWSGCNTTFTNANIHNDGTILLAESETVVEIPFDDITGSGSIVLKAISYDEAGNETIAPLYKTLYLQSNSAYSGNDYGFTWTESETNRGYDTLTIPETGLTIIADGRGIDIPQDATIVLNGDLNITAYGDGIYAESGDITIKGTGTLTIQCYASGIDAQAGSISITDVTVEDNSFDGIYAGVSSGSEDSTITIGGEAQVETGFIGTDGTAIDIEDTASVTADYGIQILNESGKVTVGDNATLNALASVLIQQGSPTTFADTVYGEVTSYDGYLFNGYGTLAFAENSSLTILASAIGFWAEYDSITWTNANITNHGAIYLDSVDFADGASIAALGITGDGYIITYDTKNMSEHTETAYKNDGTEVNTVNGNDPSGLCLEDEEITDQTGYTWTEGEDGVYTLLLTEETVVTTDIYISSVDSAIIMANGNVTVIGPVYVSTDLTIQGSGSLTAQAFTDQSRYQAMSVGSEAYDFTIDATVNGIIEWLGDLTVNGDLTAEYVFASNMTVNNSATVNLGQGLSLANESELPTLTLGSKIAILSPENGGYAAQYNDEEGIYIGTITTDGKMFDLNNPVNLASNIVIGAKPSSGGSSNVGTVVTPDDKTDVTTETETTTDPEEEDTTTTETAGTVAGMDDVSTEDYFAEAVEWAVENEVTTGTTDSGFSPDSPASRGQVVTFLYRAFGEPETTGENTFADVDEDSYYGNAVKWTLEMGITAGMGDGIFGTEETCTRAQIITFLWRAAGSPAVDGDHDFTDVEGDSYYEMALLWAVENGLTNGMGDGTFGVDEPCTRAQIVTFLYRFFH